MTGASTQIESRRMTPRAAVAQQLTRGHRLRRAYVGFSTPIGYDYRHLVRKAESDTSDSPNPVLVGSMGLFLLFDEIWFPCASVCPDNMRDLPYVHYLEELRPTIPLFPHEILDRWPAPEDGTSIFEVHPDGYGGLTGLYYGRANGVDNHTHGLNCFEADFHGNPTPSNLVLDLYLVDLFHELDLTLVLNESTATYAFPNGWDYLRGRDAGKEISLVERALEISSLYDITGVDGPYHPLVQELREHRYLEAFRKWANCEVTRLDNRTVEDIVQELDATVAEFADRALRKVVGDGGLKHVTVDVAKGIVLDLAPGAHTVARSLSIIRSHKDGQVRKLNAFVAKTRGQLWTEYFKARQAQRLSR